MSQKMEQNEIFFFHSIAKQNKKNEMKPAMQPSTATTQQHKERNNSRKSNFVVGVDG